MYHTLGQVLGLGATALSIIVPLFKKKWQMVLNTLLINILIALNFIFIGEIGSAAYLCMVAVVQCVISLIHLRRHTKATGTETAIFLFLYLGFGLLGLMSSPDFVWAVNARNLLELLPICGALVSMIFVFIPDEQKARWCLLLTCSIWAVYMGIIGSTAVFSQLATAAITVAALFKYHKKS